MEKEIKENTKLIELKVVSRLLADRMLSEHGFVSYVIPNIEKVFFDWGKCFDEQLDIILKNKEDNLFYITDRHDSESGQIVRLLPESFIQINPNFIITSETAKQTDLVKSGGTFNKVANLKEKGIKKLDASFKKLTLSNEKTIYVQKTWG